MIQEVLPTGPDQEQVPQSFLWLGATTLHDLAASAEQQATQALGAQPPQRVFGADLAVDLGKRDQFGVDAFTTVRHYTQVTTGKPPTVDDLGGPDG